MTFCEDYCRDVRSSRPAGSGGELDFFTFLGIMHRQLQQEAPEREILEALRMADKEERGFVLASELRAKLTALGEKLTDQEGENRRHPGARFFFFFFSFLRLLLLFLYVREHI